MGQEFTNALQQTPLWRFANRVYLPNKIELLAWQNDKAAQVNDIIAIAFALQRGLSLPTCWWQDDTLTQLRPLIGRVRECRTGLDGALKDAALTFELMLEGLDIQLLQSLFVHAPLGPSDLVGHYELSVGVKKGALAPLVQTLLRVTDST